MTVDEHRGFVPPPYPYDRLLDLVAEADRLDGGAVDLSIGTPCDPPSAAVLEAQRSGHARGPAVAELRFARRELFGRRPGHVRSPGGLAS